MSVAADEEKRRMNDNDGYAAIHPSPTQLHRGTLCFAGRRYVCALGRSGVRRDKREGDGATPAGRYPIRRILYRSDKIELPPMAFASAAIAPDVGWCDDPSSVSYNLPVRHPFHGGAEQLWRADNLYDIVAVLGHNDAPVLPGHGSAIFLHVAEPGYAATAGCVALRREDLLDVLTASGLIGLDIFAP